MTMGALMMSNLLDGFIRNESEDYEMRHWVWRHYGTSTRALYTMFEFTLSGCWPGYARPIMEEVSYAFAPFFIIYVCFVLFAVLRVITAIFLKETMDTANNDTEMLIAERAR